MSRQATSCAEREEKGAWTEISFGMKKFEGFLFCCVYLPLTFFKVEVEKLEQANLEQKILKYTFH